MQLNLEFDHYNRFLQKKQYKNVEKFNFVQFLLCSDSKSAIRSNGQQFDESESNDSKRCKGRIQDECGKIYY